MYATSSSSTTTTVLGSPPQTHVSTTTTTNHFVYPQTAMFGASIENVRMFAPILKSIHIRDWILLAISNRGIRATVSDSAGTVQATAYIPKEMFSSFQYLPGKCLLESSTPSHNSATTDGYDLELAVDMAILLDILNLYNSANVHIHSGNAPASLEAHAASASAGTDSHKSGQTSVGGVAKLSVWCKDESSPLELCIEESGIVTNACIDTFTTPDNAHLNLQAEWESTGQAAYKIILPASLLREALMDVGVREYTSTTVQRSSNTWRTNTTTASQYVESHMFSHASDRFVHFHIVPGQGLVLQTEGPAGSATVKLNSESMDVFQAPKVPMVAKFAGQALDTLVRALGLAHQVSIRANHAGFLNVQALVVVRDGGVNCFIEFVISPLETDLNRPAGGSDTE